MKICAHTRIHWPTFVASGENSPFFANFTVCQVKQKKVGEEKRMGGRGSDPSDCFLPLRAPFPPSQNPLRKHSFFRKGVGGPEEFRGDSLTFCLPKKGGSA